MAHRIETVSRRPDLAALVAQWRVDTFTGWSTRYTAAGIAAGILAPSAGPRETFVLFEDDRPIATAALAPTDLAARPDLTPWLAGVIVLPGFQGRGHAATLVRQVEGFARDAGVPVLWLYTTAAEGLYLRLGWERVGLEPDHGREVALMRRRLDGNG